MRKSVLLFLFSLFILCAAGHSNLTNNYSRYTLPLADRILSSAIHGIVTRTIVIDYSPFPDLANSVDNAIIRDDESVDLQNNELKNPCQKVQTKNQESESLEKSSIKIVAEKEVLCEKQGGTLTAVGAINYTWSTGQQSNSIVIAPAATSTFFVVGLDRMGCKSKAYFVQRVEGCTDQAGAENILSVFPNPAAGRFFVKIGAEGKEFTFIVYNETGRIIKEETISAADIEIDLSGHPDGIYLLRLVEFGKEIQRKRLFKQQ